MKIIVASFLGVPTASLSAALDVLGFPTHELPEHVSNCSKFWKRYIKGDSDIENFRQYYNNAEAVVGAPVNACWREILEEYPDSKVCISIG